MAAASPGPDSVAELEALFSLAQHEHRAGRLAEAAEAYGKILAIRPDIAEIHNNLGVVLRTLGQLDQAVARYRQAIALKPDLADAHNNLGNVLREQGQLEQAAARYRQAIVLRPDYAEAHNNLGTVLLIQGKLDEAAARLTQALDLRPDYAEAHNNLGNVLLTQDKLELAARRYRQALALRPNYTEAHSNFGNALLSQGKLDEAAAQCEYALALRPDYAEAHNSLGIVRWEQGKFKEAAARFERALALRPDYAEPHWGLAACYLVEGDYERGWPAYEGRLRTPGLEPRHSLPRWAGEPLAGRSLLLFAEQGLGDAIQFIRYARPLKQRGARVVLACQAALGRLLASNSDLDELFIQDSSGALPRCDYYLPLLSVPYVLRTNAATIPCEVPYLAADPKLTAEWHEQLAGIDGFKIGIAWQGSRDFRFDGWRSIPLAQFAPLAGLPGVRLVSLQKGFGSEQVATVDFPVLDLSARLDEAAGPFMDTAAVIRGLDLVVTSDTAVAHLAGALGVPVWVALQFSPNWRWLRDREDSPWYPTMRLFRQTTFGGWADVFQRIAEAVQARRSETA